MFSPELLSGGFAGGRKAACQIISNIRNGIGAQFPSAKIWISVFANATDLGPVLFHHRYIPTLSVLDEFISGFNDIDDLVTFVNVGRGKELTDTKLNGI